MDSILENWKNTFPKDNPYSNDHAGPVKSVILLNTMEMIWMASPGAIS